MTSKTNKKTAARKSATKTKKARTSTPKPSAQKLVWRHVTCRIRHTPNYLSQGWSHIEIIVLTPKGAPIPITDTGYRSHFLDEDQLAAAGGPAKFFLDWLEREATTKAWARMEARWRQLELFAD